jgi:hypothetical protein
MTLSHASPEGEQSHVTTVPKHLADDLASILKALADMDFSERSAPSHYNLVCLSARKRLAEYRKATQ